MELEPGVYSMAHEIQNNGSILGSGKTMDFKSPLTSIISKLAPINTNIGGFNQGGSTESINEGEKKSGEFNPQS